MDNLTDANLTVAVVGLRESEDPTLALAYFSPLLTPNHPFPSPQKLHSQIMKVSSLTTKNESPEC